MKDKSIYIILFLSSLIFCLIAVNFAVYNNPNYSSKALSFYYRDLSEKSSPNSIQAKRYRAMADALLNSQNTYYFTAARIPAVGSSQ